MNPLYELFRRMQRSNPKDYGSIVNEVYNEAAGSYKMMLVEPVVIKPVLAGDMLAPGSYVKITGTSYTLQLLNKAYNPATVYRRNSVVTQAGNIYVAETDGITGVFDSQYWRVVAPAVVGPVTVAAGSVVSNGRYHNNINAAGFLVDDRSEITKVEN
jgi:hypothetical protein